MQIVSSQAFLKKKIIKKYFKMSSAAILPSMFSVKPIAVGVLPLNIV